MVHSHSYICIPLSDLSIIKCVCGNNIAVVSDAEGLEMGYGLWYEFTEAGERDMPFFSNASHKSWSVKGAKGSTGGSGTVLDTVFPHRRSSQLGNSQLGNSQQ
ncbi:uncharacterized protein LOC113566208 [Drosophila persimilis]|uniref:uncharacterized protein LOC113566208 n=1 Tax=Drosophila persimilis TaxID=7234 RepID=UPI000F07EA67|nr:uncharacterized protein LOC113566208 [Drosophila persimilis]